MANDPFRMVSLRHSKALQRDGTPALDPHLSYELRLEEQASITPSPREIELQQLKKLRAALSKKMTQPETVQRALVDTFMAKLVEQRDPSPMPIPETQSTCRLAAVTGARSQRVIGRVPGEALVY